MILTDDNFATIATAIRQGSALCNIVKFIRFQLSTTIGAILTVFFAPLAGLPEPFTPLQMATIMDGPPVVSLALDAARPGLMLEPPRPIQAPLPFARVVMIAAFGLTMMVGTLAVLHYGLRTGAQDRALSLAFTTFVLFQFFNMFNARVENGSAFNAQFFANPMMWLSLSGVVVGRVTVSIGYTGLEVRDNDRLAVALNPIGSDLDEGRGVLRVRSAVGNSKKADRIELE